MREWAHLSASLPPSTSPDTSSGCFFSSGSRLGSPYFHPDSPDQETSKPVRLGFCSVRTDSSHARDLCPRDQHGQDVGETAQLAEHHNAVGNLAREGRVAVAGQDPDTSAHTFITSTQQAPGRNTNATSITSMHHRHRRPPPVQRFTPYPPIHVADLSCPAARQPSHPGFPIPQLLAPRRRQRPYLRPVLLSSRYARFQSEPPWGYFCYVNYDFLPAGEEVFAACAQPRRVRGINLLPDRLDGCLASRLDHRPPSTSTSPFTRGQKQTNTCDHCTRRSRA